MSEPQDPVAMLARVRAIDHNASRGLDVVPLDTDEGMVWSIRAGGLEVGRLHEEPLADLLILAPALADECERLEHSLSDAMKHLSAIQGTNETHMARVRELEMEAVGHKNVISATMAVETGLHEQVRELEARLEPRPMGTAPRDTDIMLAIGARFRGEDEEPFRMGLLGWLPLTDQPEREESGTEAGDVPDREGGADVP